MKGKDAKARDESYGTRKAGVIRSSDAAPASKSGHWQGELCWIKKYYTHALLFVGVLTVYVLTISPSVTGGDAGELLAEACHFGIPHPPGYPILTGLNYLLSKLIRTGVLPTLRPPATNDCVDVTHGSVALAANVCSAILGATTAVLLAVTIETWLAGLGTARGIGAASTGAVLFSLSPLAWEYHTGFEVFALNNTLVAAGLLLAARIVRRPNKRDACMGAVVCGLACCNQQASILVLAPLTIFVLSVLHEASLVSWGSMAQWGGLWLPLGLSPQVLLWVAALGPQQGSWGDLSTIRGMLRHVLRQEYGTLRLGIPTLDAESGLERTRAYLLDSTVQTTCFGPFLALIGIVWVVLAPTCTGPKAFQVAEKVRKFGFGLLASWTFHVVVWHTVLSNIPLNQAMSRAVHARFWIQPNLLLCVAAGAGVRLFMDTVSGWIWRSRLPDRIRHRRVMGAVASASIPVALGLYLTKYKWNAMNRGAWSGRSDGWTMHLYGQAILSSLPQQSILVSHTDLDLNAARYLRVCEGLRKDVSHISLQMVPYPWWNTVQAKLHPGITFPPTFRGVSTRRESEGNALLVTRFLAANLELGRPIFLDMQAVDDKEIGAVGEYRGLSLIPHGLTYRVRSKVLPHETEMWHEEIVTQVHRLEDCMQPAPIERYPTGSWEFAATSVYWDAHYQAGLFFLSYVIEVWDSTPGKEQRKHALPALRQASQLLMRTLEAADANKTFSSSRADLLKNTVLAQARLHHALHAAWILETKSVGMMATKELPQAVSRLYEEVIWAKEQCLNLIPRFLREAKDDKDTEVFGRIYTKLRESKD